MNKVNFVIDREGNKIFIGDKVIWANKNWVGTMTEVILALRQEYGSGPFKVLDIKEDDRGIFFLIVEVDEKEDVKIKYPAIAFTRYA